MRRALCAVAAAALTGLAAVPGAFAAGARLTPSGNATFPQRSYVLTLPKGVAPTPDKVTVTENGNDVDALSVRPAGSTFAVMLAIDASKSMHGQPIRRAMEAARAFAASRPASQALGVVFFNKDVTLVLPPTTNADAIRNALAKAPHLEYKTRIFDATVAGLEQIRGRYEAGAVVVLSDGDDVGSSADVARVAAAAAAHHAKLYTFGLKSRSFSPTALDGMASAGHGEYLGAVKPSELRGVYAQLGADLASVYTIRYRSLAGAHAAVRVSVRAASLTAGDRYRAPALKVAGEAPAASAAPEQGDGGGFLDSRLGALAVALAVVALLLIGLRPWFRRAGHRMSLQQRIGAYGLEIDRRTALEADGSPRRRARSRGELFVERLGRDLELAGMSMTPSRALLLTALATLLVTVLLSLAGWIPLMLAGLVGTPWTARAYLRRKVQKRRDLFADQLAGTIQSVAAAMRTGSSFIAALAHVVEESPEPMASEMRRVIADEQLGMSLEDAVEKAVERTRDADLRQIGLVAVVQRETGGNAAEPLDRVAQNIRARDDLRRRVRTLTAQGRIAARVLIGLPIVSGAGMTLISPDQMAPLFNTGTGHVILLVAVAMIALGAAWVRRVVRISV